MKYSATFSYMEPRWGDIDEAIDAESKDEAENEVMKYVEMTFPEAVDIDIQVKEIN